MDISTRRLMNQVFDAAVAWGRTHPLRSTEHGTSPEACRGPDERRHTVGKGGEEGKNVAPAGKGELLAKGLIEVCGGEAGYGNE
jgi:hypothetical protein